MLKSVILVLLRWQFESKSVFVCQTENSKAYTYVYDKENDTVSFSTNPDVVVRLSKFRIAAEHRQKR